MHEKDDVFGIFIILISAVILMVILLILHVSLAAKVQKQCKRVESLEQILTCQTISSERLSAGD